MKKVSRRALFALILAVLLLGGTALFTGNYFVSGKDWVTFSGSPHLYENGVLTTGIITDRHGEELLRYGKTRQYTEDVLLRTASLHVLGDATGNVPSLLIATYEDEMVPYDSVQGLYGAGDKTLRLTLGADVQKTAYEALDGRSGTVAAYNYRTGEILCAVSAPSFDPAIPHLQDYNNGIYVNRFTGARYTPGSVFKLVTALAALETLPEAQTQTFVCEGVVEYGPDKVTCKKAHGEVTLETALAQSCNCAFGQLANLLGAEELERYAEKLGLMESFSVDGFATATGCVQVASSAQVDLAWAGIGQHTDQINPYAFLRFVGAVAAGGAGAEPYFTAQAGDYTAKTKTTDRLCSGEAAEILQGYMRTAVQTVYGDWQFPDFTVCAKSGTAEVGEGLAPHAMFCGFATDEDCPVAFFVAVENAGAGSDEAAPIAARVLTACREALRKK